MLIDTIKKMIRALSQEELSEVATYCSRETEERTRFDMFNDILGDPTRIMEIALGDGTFVYVDKILEVVGFIGGFAARFSVLGKDPKLTKTTVRLEFSGNFQFEFCSLKPTLVIDEARQDCNFTPEVHGVKTVDEGIPVKALSICMYYRNCYDCKYAMPMEQETMELLRNCRDDKTAVIVETSACPDTPQHPEIELEDVSRESKILGKSDFEIAGYDDLSASSIDIEDELVKCDEYPLTNLQNYINNDDEVKVFCVYKSEHEVHIDKEGFRGEQRTSNTSNNLYHQLSVKKEGKSIKLIFEHEYSTESDIYEIDYNFKDIGDLDETIRVNANGEIVINLCETAALKLTLIKDGVELGYDAVVDILANGY